MPGALAESGQARVASGPLFRELQGPLPRACARRPLWAAFQWIRPVLPRSPAEQLAPPAAIGAYYDQFPAFSSPLMPPHRADMGGLSSGKCQPGGCAGTAQGPPRNPSTGRTLSTVIILDE